MRSCYKCCHTDGRTHTMDDGDIMIDGKTFRVMIYLMIIQFSIELELNDKSKMLSEIYYISHGLWLYCSKHLSLYCWNKLNSYWKNIEAM